MTMRANQRAAISADRDQWTKQALDACLASIKDLISGQAPPINPSLKLERLTDSEWAWFISSIIGSWIRTRSEQAAVEGWNYERACHTADLEPDPWAEGAAATVLPKLADACPGLDWSQPVGEWAKHDIIAFLVAAYGLIQHAFAARDAAENPPDAGGVNPDVTVRELSAAGGHGLLTITEHRQLDDPNAPPF
jgi:hypothetical protein